MGAGFGALQEPHMKLQDKNLLFLGDTQIKIMRYVYWLTQIPGKVLGAQ